MNTCLLMAEIIKAPELRHTPDQLAIAEMLVQFPGVRPEDPAGTVKAVGFGNLATEIHQQYRQGDRVLIEGRLTMNSIDRPEGFKEKRAELRISRIHAIAQLAQGPMQAAPTPMAAPPAPLPTPPTPITAARSASPAPYAPAPAPYAPPPAPSLPDDEPDYDDIPF
ncbi:MAG: single-stranded DNA-binding protein [Cyanobacteria bacterium]|nr:single-stranded DNA-binding protein [Cyanobacteriota bacterium]